MEHNPYITLNDETEITYSDLKRNKAGEEYITIYFETPYTKGFKSMHIDYPGDVVKDIIGYSETEVEAMLYHYNKVKELTLQFAKEEAEEERNHA